MRMVVASQDNEACKKFGREVPGGKGWTLGKYREISEAVPVWVLAFQAFQKI